MNQFFADHVGRLHSILKEEEKKEVKKEHEEGID